MFFHCLFYHTPTYGPITAIAGERAGGMSEPKSIELLEQMGVNISEGKVSSLLTKETEPWQAEADDILIAGLGSSIWQHIDDTGTRVNGVNGYCHILCNPFYTAYTTRPKKNRLTVITH